MAGSRCPVSAVARSPRSGQPDRRLDREQGRSPSSGFSSQPWYAAVFIGRAGCGVFDGRRAFVVAAAAGGSGGAPRGRRRVCERRLGSTATGPGAKGLVRQCKDDRVGPAPAARQLDCNARLDRERHRPDVAERDCLALTGPESVERFSLDNRAAPTPSVDHELDGNVSLINATGVANDDPEGDNACREDDVKPCR